VSYQLLRVTHLPGTVNEVFSFFKDPHNLEALTPPWLSFRIVSSTDALVRDGTRIVYRLALFGIPLSWESRIVDYRENSHFADEQVRGPYARWPLSMTCRLAHLVISCTFWSCNISFTRSLTIEPLQFKNDLVRRAKSKRGATTLTFSRPQP
jgi:hypothetical protein